ncbi:MAG: arginine--tRNA ligase, partial [Clostridia bacterium]|nr:arginine--tRNA ligase [Clostridia bacterium]
MGRVRARLEAALAAAVAEGELPAAVLPPPAYTVEEPRQREHGDFAANLALLLARRAGMAPRQVAEAIARRLTPGEGIAAVEVAGPGFLNVRMAPGWLLAAVDAARREGRGYGRSEVGG